MTESDFLRAHQDFKIKDLTLFPSSAAELLAVRL